MSLYKAGLASSGVEVCVGSSSNFWEQTLAGVASGLILFIFFLIARGGV